MPLKQGEVEKRERKFENVRAQRLKQKSRRQQMVEAYTAGVRSPRNLDEKENMAARGACAAGANRLTRTRTVCADFTAA
jgi:hypothetical protein